MREGFGFGWRGGRPGVIGALDRFTDRVEKTLDRAAEAMDRGVEAMERRVDEFAGKADGKAGARKPPPGTGPTAGAGPSDAGPPPRGESEDASPGRHHADAAHGDDAGPGQAASPGGGFGRGYAGVVDRTRKGVTSAVSRGAEALDGAVGDAPWRAAGLDGRRTRIAREVMRDVVPKVAGERVASVIDGAALKGGVAGAGLLMRIPLKGFAVPFLLGVTAVETVRAVREVKRSVADVAARIDNEARSEEAYRSTL